MRDGARAGGRRALQRRRPALRAARVPRGAHLPPRRRRRRSRRRRGALRRDGGSARAARSPGAPRSSGCARPTSATAARAGRSRSSCPGRPDRRRRCSPRCGRASRTSTSGSTASRTSAGSPVEIRAVRLAALGEAAATRSFQLDVDDAAGSNGATRRIGRRRARRAGADARVRSATAPEPGPLLVDEYDTTVVVPPGWTVAARRRHRDARAWSGADGD